MQAARDDNQIVMINFVIAKLYQSWGGEGYYIPVIVQNAVSFPSTETSNKSIELQNSAV